MAGGQHFTIADTTPAARIERLTKERDQQDARAMSAVNPASPAAIEWQRGRVDQSEAMRRRAYMVIVTCGVTHDDKRQTYHETMADARLWANWGHLCANLHTFEEIGERPQ